MLSFASIIFSLHLANIHVTQCRINCEDPLGELLCKKHCKQLKGCDQYSFDPNSLKCCIGVNETDLQQENAVLTKGCAWGSKIFRTRKNRIRCLTVEKRTIPGRSSENPPDKKIAFKVLIYFTGGNLTGPMNILNRQSGKLTKFQNINEAGICAMTFNKISNTLYYANKLKRHISKKVLNQLQRVVVKRDIIVKAMAMDEERELLFVSEKKQIGFLDGRVYKKVVSTKEPSDSLAVDSKQRKIYSRAAFYIYVITYDGRSSQFMEHTGKGPLAFDPNTNNLCYCLESAIVIYNLTSGRQMWRDNLRAPATDVNFVGRLIIVTVKGPFVSVYGKINDEYREVLINITWAGSDALTTIIYQ